MTFTFNAWEIFETAEEIERNGAKFYHKAAEYFRDSDTRNTLLELADWEARHEESFASIKNGLSGPERQLTVPDPDHEDALYLRAMADDHVFDTKTDPSKQLSGKESQQEILKMAIRLAKDAIAYFLGLKTLVPARRGKEKVEVIIKEEMNYIGILNKELAALK
ncbi:MAG: hypothetical protein ACYTBP_06515 [Planctomycetota bacterium]|jgi:rubrerythrin